VSRTIACECQDGILSGNVTDITFDVHHSVGCLSPCADGEGAENCRQKQSFADHNAN